MWPWTKYSPRFYLLAGWLVVIFLTGGGSRADIMSLPLLRPLAAIVLGIGILCATRQKLAPLRFVAILLGAIAVLILLHLVPLPPVLWHALPQRELVTEIGSATGLSDVWRPLTLSPNGGWNALYAMLVPLSVLALLANFSDTDRRALLVPTLLLGLLSGILGLVQSIGAEDGPLYFYAVTNNGVGVGLFANRNHQAVFLASLLPMLGLFASIRIHNTEQAQFRRVMALLFGVLVVPLVLVTGSRSGLVALFIAALLSLWVYRAPESLAPAKRGGGKMARRALPFILAGCGLAVVGLIAARPEAILRLLSTDPVAEVRFVIWPITVQAIGEYFPFGSGIGSFVEVYQIHESVESLRPEYSPHAHNDVLEALMTAGLPAAVLILAVVCSLIIAARRLHSSRNVAIDKEAAAFGRAGLALLLILGLASLSDYPLRVPSLAALAVIASVWISDALTSQTKRLERGGAIG